MGHLLATILRANPRLRGVLYDLPGVVAAARKDVHVTAAGVAERCELVEGDFFEKVPAGADTYMRGVTILARLGGRARAGDSSQLQEGDERGRASASGRQHAVAPGDAPHWGKMLDINMMVLTGGMERTEEEFRDLFARRAAPCARHSDGLPAQHRRGSGGLRPCRARQTCAAARCISSRAQMRTRRNPRGKVMRAVPFCTLRTGANRNYARLFKQRRPGRARALRDVGVSGVSRVARYGDLNGPGKSHAGADVGAGARLGPGANHQPTDQLRLAHASCFMAGGRFIGGLHQGNKELLASLDYWPPLA